MDDMAKRDQPNAGTATGPRFRRRRWWIDSTFQGRHIAQLLVLSLLAGMAAALGVWQFLAGHGGDPIVALETRLPGPLWRLIAEIAFVILIVVPVAGLFLSHRAAGPAYRFRQSFAEVARGRLGFRIKLRRADQMKSTAEAFNRMIEALEERRKAAGQDRTEIAQAISTALEKLKSSDETELPEALRLLEEAESRLRKESGIDTPSVGDIR
jgi:methyl-accepting chemotaxis protein